MREREAVALDKLVTRWEREADDLDFSRSGPCPEADRLRRCARELRLVLHLARHGGTPRRS